MKLLLKLNEIVARLDRIEKKLDGLDELIRLDVKLDGLTKQEVDELIKGRKDDTLLLKLRDALHDHRVQLEQAIASDKS